MVAARLDLTGDRIIEEGSFWGLTVQHPGDLTGVTAKGVIKASYDGPQIVAFKTIPIVFNEAMNKSEIFIYLTAQDTRRIKPTESHYVYDVLLVNPGALDSPSRMLQGIVHISQGVTDA